jgi:hypothetical protein
MALLWTNPSEGLLTTLLEATVGDPVYTTQFEVQDTLSSTPELTFFHLSGDIPEYYEIINDGINTATFNITPNVRELDDYVEEYAQPPDFTYDNTSNAGGDYATYGSALSGGKTLTFTIRAVLTSSMDSNGNYSDILDSNGTISNYTDRTFSIHVQNNWSSDRDRFIRFYYEGIGLEYEGNTLSANEWILQQKENGYYV